MVFAYTESRLECTECDWWVPRGCEVEANDHDCALHSRNSAYLSSVGFTVGELKDAN